MQNENFYSYLVSVLNEAMKKQTEDENRTILDGAPKIKKPENEFEEIPPDEELPVEEVSPEEDPTIEEEIPTEEADAEVGSTMADDVAYMNLPPEPAVPSIDEITKQEQKKKLFNEFDDLRTLIEYTFKNFDERLNFDLLDSKQISGLNFAIDTLKKLADKLSDFQLKSFIVREYEECLYTYMLMRSEFLTTIKFIRKLLSLNVLPDEEKK